MVSLSVSFLLIKKILRLLRLSVFLLSLLLAGLLKFFLFLFLFFFRPESVWVYVGLSAFAWLGLGVFTMVSWALITDVIDYSELKNGIREDGTVYALYSFSRKLGQAAAAGLSGGLLTLIGYSELTAFDKDVVNGIFDISTIIPTIGFALLSLILWFWYPLHKKQVEQNIARLKEKH